MRLQQLEHLLAAADAGSLRAAARRIGLSQPAITKSLRQLEHALHVRLLHRSANGISLTQAGKAVAARARVIQTELRKAGEDISALQGGMEGSVAVGVAPATSVALMPEALRRFRDEWPAARVRIIEGVRNYLIPLVRDGTLDLAVAQRQPGADESGIRFRPLFRPRLAVACRHDHPLAGARSLAALADVSWLVFYPPGSGGALERSFAAAGLPAPRMQVHCESYSTALSLIAGSNLMGLVVEKLLLSEPLSRNYLRKVPVRDPIEPPTIGVFSRDESPHSPAAAAMLRAIIAVTRELPATPI